jgi:hypothetical protein
VGEAFCHAVAGNKEGAKCVLCYEREEMVTKGIISDKPITKIRTIYREALTRITFGNSVHTSQ